MEERGREMGMGRQKGGSVRVKGKCEGEEEEEVKGTEGEEEEVEVKGNQEEGREERK